MKNLWLALNAGRRLLLDKSGLRLLLDTLNVLRGAVVFALSKTTPPGSYQAFIRLFCRTGGRSNDIMTRAIALMDRPLEFPKPAGQLGIHDFRDAKSAADQIRTQGYFVFPHRLADDVCERLLRFALSTSAAIRPMSGTPQTSAPCRSVYDRARPMAVRYDFDTSDVLACEDVQDLMANPSVLNVAQQYLGSTPIADVTSMWWHTAFSDQPDEEAAQFFHFDMDRIKWLKFFIYLTDVNAENGPHHFVAGSHRTGGIPAALLAKGYSRLTDDEVSQNFTPERLIEFVAPRGTILAEDTRGLHKGLEVRKGDRLMLQLQFSNCLFGGTYKPASFRSMTTSLRETARRYPSIYMNYVEHEHR
jgi:ectoine hydroxylase-related dioxygenase (phytanoyl-CoA dioxygenase family)